MIKVALLLANLHERKRKVSQDQEMGIQKRKENMESDLNDSWVELENSLQTMTDKEKLRVFGVLFKRTNKFCGLLKEIGDTESLVTGQAREDELRNIVDHLRSKGKRY